MPIYPASHHSSENVLRDVHDSLTQTLRTTATAIIAPGLDVDISHTDDSIRLGNGTNFLTSSTVSGKIGLDVNIINSVDISGSVVGLDSATLAALENINVTVTSIGEVEIKNDAGSPVPISVLTLPLPTGAATEITLNSILTELQQKTEPNDSQTVNANNLDIRDLTFSNDKVDVTGSVVSLDSTSLAALENINVTVTNEIEVKNDIGNPVPISAASLPLPTGAATESTLSLINSKLVNGNDIGDVTINNGPGASSVNIQDGGNSITVDAIDLDIRDLSHLQDSVKIGDGVDFVAITNNGDMTTADISNNGGLHIALNIGTVAVELKVGSSALNNRKSATLFNNSNSIIYWGYTNTVTTTSGTPIFKNQFVEWAAGQNTSIWLIAGTATNDTRITENA